MYQAMGAWQGFTNIVTSFVQRKSSSFSSIAEKAGVPANQNASSPFLDKAGVSVTT